LHERGSREASSSNYPESVALITDFVLEGARDGKSVAELMSESGKVLYARSGHGRHPGMIHECKWKQLFR